MEFEDIDFKEFREKYKLTQGDMAVKLGVNIATYRQWEKNHASPNAENEKKLIALVEKIKKED
jgi:DNA-binding transcriptional regulator YiaG